MWKRCFSRAQFLITWQSGRPHPLLFSVITKQIIAECQGNFQIITGVAEKDVSPFSCPYSLCWWQYISLCSENLKYSSILSARTYYSFLGTVEIQFSNQSVELGISQKWPIPCGRLLSPSYRLSFAYMSLSHQCLPPSLHDRNNNRICRVFFSGAE